MSVKMIVASLQLIRIHNTNALRKINVVLGWMLLETEKSTESPQFFFFRKEIFEIRLDKGMVCDPGSHQQFVIQ